MFYTFGPAAPQYTLHTVGTGATEVIYFHFSLNPPPPSESNTIRKKLMYH